MITNKQTDTPYKKYAVETDNTLLQWLTENLTGYSRSKVKAILHGQGVFVDGKCVTQFDFPLTKGMRVSVRQSKKAASFKSRSLKVVYADRYLIVIDKSVGVYASELGAL